jgi:hypothetical protein
MPFYLVFKVSTNRSRGHNKPSETVSSRNPEGLKKVNLKGKNEPLAQQLWDTLQGGGTEVCDLIFGAVA